MSRRGGLALAVARSAVLLIGWRAGERHGGHGAVRRHDRRRVHVLEPVEVARAVGQAGVLKRVGLAHGRGAEARDQGLREARPGAARARPAVDVEAEVVELGARAPGQADLAVAGHGVERHQLDRGRAVELVGADVPGHGADLAVDVVGEARGQVHAGRVEHGRQGRRSGQVQVLRAIGDALEVGGVGVLVDLGRPDRRGVGRDVEALGQHAAVDRAVADLDGVHGGDVADVVVLRDHRHRSAPEGLGVDAPGRAAVRRTGAAGVVDPEDRVVLHVGRSARADVDARDVADVRDVRDVVDQVVGDGHGRAQAGVRRGCPGCPSTPRSQSPPAVVCRSWMMIESIRMSPTLG